MNNSKNKLSLALLAVLCIVMVAMGMWGFTLSNTVTLSAAELAAPAATLVSLALCLGYLRRHYPPAARGARQAPGRGKTPVR